MNPFKQRSSIPSSFVTALVGWTGFIFIGPLIFGFRVSSPTLFLLALSCAVVQVIFLRALFFVLQMHRHILVGAFWGLASALALYFLCAYFFPFMKEKQLLWLLIYAYIGAPVGAFLSYFYRDDKKIFGQGGQAHEQPNFGRDAHWLEPFAYGAVAYLLSFIPFMSSDLLINVFIVGAMSGVFAAGASHFSPDKWKFSWLTLFLLVITVGSVQGFLFSLLFRAFRHETFFDYRLHGVLAGVLTYLITFLRGRGLAMKEEKGEL